MAPHWRDRIAPGAPQLNWTKERDGSWSALGRFRLIKLLDDRWALEDLTREPRLVGMYTRRPLAPGVAAYVVANESGGPKKEGR